MDPNDVDYQPYSSKKRKRDLAESRECARGLARLAEAAEKVSSKAESQQIQQTTPAHAQQTRARTRLSLSEVDQRAMSEILEMALPTQAGMPMQTVIHDQHFGTSESHPAESLPHFNQGVCHLAPSSDPRASGRVNELGTSSNVVMGEIASGFQASSVFVGTPSVTNVEEAAPTPNLEVAAPVQVDASAGQGLVSRKKRGAKKETPMPEPSWRIDDFLKDEAWFRDVVGLPGTGAVPSTLEVSAADMAAYYGEKMQQGYPLKGPKSHLSQEIREELLHLATFTDGRPLIINDQIGVIFAKGFYKWKVEGLSINWARFAAGKHKNQLEGQWKRKKEAPDPDTGIRDENARYFPFGTAPLDPNSLPPSVVDQRTGLDVQLKGKTLGSLPGVETCPSLPCARGVGESSNTAWEGELASDHGGSPWSVRSAGSLQIAAGNYQLLDDYLKELAKEKDQLRIQFETASRGQEALRKKLSENKKLTEECMTELVTEKQALDSEDNQLSKLSVELQELKRVRCQLQEEIDSNCDKANDAKESEEDEDLIEEWENAARIGEDRLVGVSKEIEEKGSSLDGLQISTKQRKRKIENLSTHSQILELEKVAVEKDIEVLKPDIKDMETRSSKLQGIETEFLAIKKTVAAVHGQVVSPRMIPSPVKGVAALFKITNCPICHLSFSCCNFLPVSCGHCYHPACGIPFFLSQQEPRCKTCDQLVHVSWLNTWGIKPGKANLEIAEALGLSQFESALVKEDIALRKDEDAYEQLQFENKSSSRSVTRFYSPEGVLSQRTMNSTHFAVLRGGGRDRSPMTMPSASKLFDALTPDGKATANKNANNVAHAPEVIMSKPISDDHAGTAVETDAKLLVPKIEEKVEKEKSLAVDSEDDEVVELSPPQPVITRSKTQGKSIAIRNKKNGRKRKADEEVKGVKRRSTESDLGSSYSVIGANSCDAGTAEKGKVKTKQMDITKSREVVGASRKGTVRNLVLGFGHK